MKWIRKKVSDADAAGEDMDLEDEDDSSGDDAEADADVEIATAGEDGVTPLVEQTFKKALAENDAVFVEFYASWCGHCKELAPKYAEAAKSLKQGGVPVLVAKVDAPSNEALARKHGVKSFPTLLLFRKGETAWKQYEGQRTTQAMVVWVKRQLGMGLNAEDQ